MKLSIQPLLYSCLAASLCSGIVYARVEAKGDCDVQTDDILCRYTCGPEQLQPMCVEGKCYCTDVGYGSCKTGNNGAGCKAVCEFLGKTSSGCFEGQCSCQ